MQDQGRGRRRHLARHAWAAALAAAALSGVTLGAGCTAAPPSGWAEGGAKLAVPRARWIAGEVAVDLDGQGRVMVGGHHRFTVDAAGRVFDPDGVPIALLTADGHLLGIDDRPLGWVGASQANLPDDGGKWLELYPSGELSRVDDEGRGRPFGVWMGCTQVAYTTQTCLLVSHLLGLELRERAREASGVSVGVGIGVGVSIP